MAIHKSAIICDDAQIASDVEIAPNVIIGEGVIIEAGVKIGAGSHIEFATIGKCTKISPMVSIGGEPQDLGYKGEKTRVIIGADTQIREFVTINRASGEGCVTKIGNKCMLMAYAHVAHNCIVADEVIMANAATIGGHVEVGFGAFLGGQTVFHQNIRIGEMSITSGAAAARRDIIPYCKAEGIPAVPIGLNSIALRRRSVDRATCDALHKTIRILRSAEYNTTQALEVIDQTVDKNEYVIKLLDFVKTSKRGISLRVKGAFYGNMEPDNE